MLIVFCRVGGCLMLTPGISSSQIPVQVRLFIAVGVSLSLWPIMLGSTQPHGSSGDPILILRYVLSETLIGATIGLLSRLFFLALETLATASAAMIGLSNPFGIEVEANQMLPPVANFITLSATALVFFTNLDSEIVIGLARSYDVIPAGSWFDSHFALHQVGLVLSAAFETSLRVCAPFFLYAVVVNLAVSLINRLTPQVAVFFIATPFVIGMGLLLLYYVVTDALGQFLAVFSDHLIRG